MITIVRRKQYYWRSIYSAQPAMVAELSLGDAWGWTTAALPPAYAELLAAKLTELPLGPPPLGAAELIARVAQALQSISDVAEPEARLHDHDEAKRQATIRFASMDPFIANGALLASVEVVREILAGRMAPPAFAQLLDRCLGFVHNAGLDQSTRAMIRKAQERDIPWFRPTGFSRHVQLGQGHRQHVIRETLTNGQSAVGRELVRNKLLTYEMLAPLGLPVGQHALVHDADQALAAAKTIGYPIVLKKIEGGKGAGVYPGLRNADELTAALRAAAGDPGGLYILQTFFPGDDVRILVVSGKFVAAALKTPATLTGDGVRTIAQLVAEANRDPRRGPGFTKLMNLIETDAETSRTLARQGLTLQSVPPAGTAVRLRDTANIATGGTAVDVTHTIHPDNIRMAERAAKALDLDIAGMDFVSPDISRSWREVGGGICELNTIVGVRPHWLANPQQDVIGPILDTIYKRGDTGRIPTAMITGTKGKTTTSLMLRSILAAAGHVVGCATSEGATVGDEEILAGDVAGYQGAVPVMRDPLVTAAVLETARGGMIKHGQYLDWCDVAALLNVGREQIGIDGIETLDDMAALKGTVLDAARKAAVLNADDPRCLALADTHRARLRTILFSLEPHSSGVSIHIENGGEAILVKMAGGRERLVLESRTDTLPLIAVNEMPATLGGLMRPNVANAMAAAGLAIGLGVDLRHIREGLSRYELSVAASKGRFNFVEGFPVKMFFDLAVAPPSFAATIPVLQAMNISGRRICAITVPGNRPQWHAEECANAVAGYFDRFVCYERDDYRRGKQPGEIAALLSRQLQAAGVKPAAIAPAHSVSEAARIIAGEAGENDFVAVFGTNVRTSIDQFRTAFRDAGKIA